MNLNHYKIRITKRFTGTKKITRYENIWQQYLPLYKEEAGNEYVWGWVDIPAEWETQADEEKYKKASDYEYRNMR